MDTLQLIVPKEVCAGEMAPLGATLTEKGVNFAIFSQHAQEVLLLLFDDTLDGQPTDTIKLNRTENVWHVFVNGLKAGQLYGYKISGDYHPAEGKRFNPHKLLIDPYAKAISRNFQDRDHLLFSYDVLSPDKDMVMDVRNSCAVMPKSVVVDDSFDWENDHRPGIPMEKLVIYEVHVKGFTAHRSSRVKHPGTYLGFIEKIPYLKELGINAVELMPIHAFYVRNELLERGLNDFWGYNSIGFFAPEWSYSTQAFPGCQVAEFKELVKALHKARIEVILDVVFNHTGEGNHLGPTLCFKGIDNPNYYCLVGDGNNQGPYRYYLNDSGCGNTKIKTR